MYVNVDETFFFPKAAITQLDLSHKMLALQEISPSREMQSHSLQGTAPEWCGDLPSVTQQ